MRWLAGALVTLAMTGCGSDEYRMIDVRGKVLTCEGQPATGGTIIFFPIDDPSVSGRPKGDPGREARGVIGEDGSFTLTSIGMEEMAGVVAGKHRVKFEMPPTTKPKLTEADKSILSKEEIAKWESEYANRPVYKPLPCSANLEPAEAVVTDAEKVLEFKLLKK
jgi:hypothetical protein